MALKENIEIIWSFGLSEMQEQKLAQLVGKKYQVYSWPIGIVPSLEDYENLKPVLAVFTIDATKKLTALPEDSVRHLELIPKILFLDEGYTQQDLEFAIDSGMSEIIRPPYTKNKVASKIRRALEIESVHYDVLRMSKEIILEREILERKNDILNFLVGFLTSTSVSMCPAKLLEITAKKLQMLFPVRSLHAAIWNPSDPTGDMDVFISAPKKHASFEAWSNAVREAVQKSRPGIALNLNIAKLECCEQGEKWHKALPSDGYVLTLPINVNNEQFGVILILTDMLRSLSRDQAMALNSALQHLGLTIQNAQHFNKLKEQVEYDGLTGLYNRRHLEARIKSEVDRASRYGHPLSVIFADLDKFKSVNDTLGHHAGDAVLKKVADILRVERRSSDYVSRYGGEEFVIILPHTDIKQAYMLAERIRLAVEKHLFDTGKGMINISISQGVAQLSPEMDKKPESLLCAADRAMYQAKNSGRNRTEIYNVTPAGVAV